MIPPGEQERQAKLDILFRFGGTRAYELVNGPQKSDLGSGNSQLIFMNLSFKERYVKVGLALIHKGVNLFGPVGPFNEIPRETNIT